MSLGHGYTHLGLGSLKGWKSHHPACHWVSSLTLAFEGDTELAFISSAIRAVDAVNDGRMSLTRLVTRIRQASRRALNLFESHRRDDCYPPTHPRKIHPWATNRYTRANICRSYSSPHHAVRKSGQPGITLTIIIHLLIL